MTDTPKSQADLRHDKLLEIVQELARVTYPPGKGDPSGAPVPHSESGLAWWNRVLRLSGIDVFLPDSEDLRFRELLRVWEHCCDKQYERKIAWESKVEEWYPEIKELEDMPV